MAGSIWEYFAWLAEDEEALDLAPFENVGDAVEAFEQAWSILKDNHLLPREQFTDAELGVIYGEPILSRHEHEHVCPTCERPLLLSSIGSGPPEDWAPDVYAELYTESGTPTPQVVDGWFRDWDLWQKLRPLYKRAKATPAQLHRQRDEIQANIRKLGSTDK